MNKIRLKYGSNALLLTVIVLGILVVLNVILAQKPIKWDTTRTGEFSLSSKTKQVLKSLKKDVTVYAFFKDGDPSKTKVQDLLDQYTSRTNKIKVKFIDPDKNPSEASKYGITNYNTTLFMLSNDQSKRQIVNDYDIFNVQTGQDPSTATFNGEQQFTQAIINLTETKKINAYIVQGHDEVNSLDYLMTFKNSLTGEGYNVNDLNIAQSGGIPKDAGLLVIVNPQRDYATQEVNAIKNYLNKGGKAIILMGAENGPLKQKSVNDILATWGIKFNNDVVIDPARNYFMNALAPVPQYNYHKITQQLDFSNMALYMPSSRSISYNKKTSGDITVEPLLTTSDKAWGETNFSKKQASFDKSDIKGPLTMGVAISNNKTGMKIVALGNDLIATDKVILQGGNKDLLMNSANWMSNKTNQIAISPKSLDYPHVYMTGSQAKLVFYSTIVIIPLVMWFLGGFIWFRRRAL